MQKTQKLTRIPFTKSGFDKLKIKYNRFLLERPEAVKTLTAARELGDLSENGLYKAARAKLSSIDSNLFRLEMMIKLADVIDNPDTSVAGIGSRVTVSDEKNILDYEIVGKYESDPKNRKISDLSPIGKALVGRKVGEQVNINIPSGQLSYKILKIGK